MKIGFSHSHILFKKPAVATHSAIQAHDCLIPNMQSRVLRMREDITTHAR